MQLDDIRKQFASTVRRTADAMTINEARKQLGELQEELAYLSAERELSGDSIVAVRGEMAWYGLKIQQRTIPALAELSAACLLYAGKEAVRNCTPIPKSEADGTPVCGRDGRPIIIPAPFKM